MGKIEKAGVFDGIDIERYHHDPHLCDGPSISSSGLKQLLPTSGSCPAKFWAFYPGNENRFQPKVTKALDIGRAAHSLTLGEPEFARAFVVSPYDNHAKNPGYEWYNKTWKPEVEAGREKRTLIKPDEFEMVSAVSQVQKRSAQVMRAFEDGKPEQSLIWRDEETGIWLRSRPDWLPTDPAKRLVTEYKTAESIEPDKMSSDAFKYGYEVQGALILDGIKAVLGIEPLGIVYICQEKDPPYLAEARLFTPEQLEDGRFLYRRALEIFAHCLKSGEWPGYTQEPTYFTTPYRHAMQMESMRHDTHGYTSAPLDRSKAYRPEEYLVAG